MQLEEAYAIEITKLVEYADSKEDPLIQIVRTHQHNINWDRGSTVVNGRSLVRFQMVSMEFFIDIILPITLWPWGRLSL